MQSNSIISALLAYSPLEESDNQYRLDIISHIQKYPESWWQRGTLAGHVTASAWIVNREKTSVLFLHHRKLNKWLQPGGHLDDTDLSPAQGALREAIEETGIKNLSLLDWQNAPENPPIFDVDVHPIPARGDEPSHFHYDVRYEIALPASDSEAVLISNESLGFRWFSLDEISREHEPSLARMAKKTLLSA